MLSKKTNLLQVNEEVNVSSNGEHADLLVISTIIPSEHGVNMFTSLTSLIIN